VSIPTIVETAGRARRSASSPARSTTDALTPDPAPRRALRLPQVPVAVLVPACTLALAALAVAACVTTSSLWPAVLLPLVGVALGGAALPRAGALASAVALAAGVVAAVALLGPDAGPLAVTALLASATVGAATAVAWSAQRREADAALVASRQVAQAVSVIDEATGCVNPHGLDLIARHVLGLVRRHSWAMHASMVRVGDLDVVEDLGGSEAVDRVTGLLADALRASTRGADVVCRWAPDVFLVVGPGTGMPPVELERRLRARVLGESGLPAARWACPVTVGSSLLEPWDTGGLDVLLSRAEEDLGLRRALREPSTAAPERAGSRSPLTP